MKASLTLTIDVDDARESRPIMLVGVILVMPIIAGTAIFAYRVFGGKATNLSYD